MALLASPSPPPLGRVAAERRQRRALCAPAYRLGRASLIENGPASEARSRLTANLLAGEGFERTHLARRSRRSASVSSGPAASDRRLRLAGSTSQVRLQRLTLPLAGSRAVGGARRSTGEEEPSAMARPVRGAETARARPETPVRRGSVRGELVRPSCGVRSSAYAFYSPPLVHPLSDLAGAGGATAAAWPCSLTTDASISSRLGGPPPSPSSPPRPPPRRRPRPLVHLGSAPRPSAGHMSSLLDLLSGVALAHERRIRTQSEPGVRAAGPRSTTARPPLSHSAQHSGPAQGSAAGRAAAPWAPSPSSRPPATALPPPPRPRTRLPFPSVLDLPPTTSGLAVQRNSGTYMQSDASGRAVAYRQQHTRSADGPLAALLATPRSHALSAPFAAPEGGRARGSHGASHAFGPDGCRPKSVAMVRQQHALPSGLVRPAGAPPTFVAPTILRPPVLPPLSTTMHSAPSRPPHRKPCTEQGANLERDGPLPVSPPGRNASFATKASFEPVAPSAHAVSSPKAGKKASGRKKDKVKAAPRPLSRIKLAKRAPRDMDGCDPIVSCTLWEDERTVAMQVLVEGHVVARRADNDWVNATKIVNMVPGMTRGKRDTVLKSRFGDSERIIFRRGALHLKGVWVPLSDAAELAQDFGLCDRLYPLFEDNIRSFLFRPVNQERTRLLVVAARERAALCKMPDASSGLSQDLREELRIRGEELERLLQYLEKGLGMPGPSGPSSAQPGACFVGREGNGVAQEQSHASVGRATGSLGISCASAPTALLLADLSEPQSPPSPPPSGGLVRSTRQQQGLAATYRTRFGYPPEGPPPPDDAVHRASSGSRLPPSASELLHLARSSASASSAHTPATLSQRPHEAPARALECSPHTSADSTSAPLLSWFDNPTPPENPIDEYFGPPVSASRRSSVSRRRCSTVAVGRDVVKGVSRGTSGTAATVQASISSRPVPEHLERDEGGRGGSGTAQMLPLSGRDAHGRSLSLPARVGSVEKHGPVASSSLDESPLPPQSAPPEEPADYETLVAALVASLRSPPPQHSTLRLSRFSATRMSVDGAIDLVPSHVPGLLAVEPQAVPRSVGPCTPSSLDPDMQEDRDRTLLDELLDGRVVATVSARDVVAPRSSSSPTDPDRSGADGMASLPLPPYDGVGVIDDPLAASPHADGAGSRCALPPAGELEASSRSSLFANPPALARRKRVCDVVDTGTGIESASDSSPERAGHARSSKKARLVLGRGGEGSRSTSPDASTPSSTALCTARHVHQAPALARVTSPRVRHDGFDSDNLGWRALAPRRREQGREQAQGVPVLARRCCCELGGCVHSPARPGQGPDADEQGQGLHRYSGGQRQGRRPATRRLRRSLGVHHAPDDLLVDPLRRVRRAQEAPRRSACSGRDSAGVGARSGCERGRWARRARRQPGRRDPRAHDGRRRQARRATPRLQALLRRRVPHRARRGRRSAVPRRRPQLRTRHAHERLSACDLRHVQGHAHVDGLLQRGAWPVLCLVLHGGYRRDDHLRSFRRHQD